MENPFQPAKTKYILVTEKKKFETFFFFVKILHFRVKTKIFCIFYGRVDSGRVRVEKIFFSDSGWKKANPMYPWWHYLPSTTVNNFVYIHKKIGENSAYQVCFSSLFFSWNRCGRVRKFFRQLLMSNGIPSFHIFFSVIITIENALIGIPLLPFSKKNHFSSFHNIKINVIQELNEKKENTVKKRLKNLNTLIPELIPSR